MGHGPQGGHTLQEWRALQDANEWRAVRKTAGAQGHPSQQAGGQPASSSSDRPAAERADKAKRKTWEELLAEIIEEGEDEDPLVPPQKGLRKREDE